MKKKMLLVVMLFFILLSCKKNDTNNGANNNSNENILSSNAYIVDTASVTIVTDNSITLLKSNTQLRPKAGDVLLSNPTQNNPYGFLRKVISATENNSQIICNTEQSNLAEAFAQLTIDENYLDTFSSNRAFRTGAKLSVKFQDNNTIAPGIKLNGELIFNIPSVQIQYKRLKGSLAPEKVLIKADFNTDGSTLEISKTDDAALQLGEKIVTDFNLPIIRIPIPVPTPVGVIIIQIPFSQKLVIKTLPLTINGKVKWTTLPKISATLGTKYENSTWTNLSSYTIDASSMPLSQLDFTPNISINANLKFVTPEYDITPYAVDALKAFFSIPNAMDLTIQPFTSPNYSLKYKLDVTGGVKQEFFTGVKREYSITGNIATQTLLEGDWGTNNNTDTVRIGNQTWMRRNLDVETYRNGDLIPQVTDTTAWAALTTGAWCYCENNTATGTTYGKLYNWYAVHDSRGLAPVGWHVPSDSEWTILAQYLGGESVAGGKMKETGTTHWTTPNVGADNTSGFTGLPGGNRHDNGIFDAVGQFGGFWSSTDNGGGGAWYHSLYFSSSLLYTSSIGKNSGISVRCIKD